MAVFAEDPVYLELNEARPPHHSHHRFRRRTRKIAARILMVLALVIGSIAICNFALSAYTRTSFFALISTVDSEGRRVVTGTDSVSLGTLTYLSHLDEIQQLNAAAVVLAAACLVGSTLISRTLRKHQR